MGNRAVHCTLASILAFSLAGRAQQPFDLDTTFRIGFNDWYVNSIMPLDDGTILLSGQIRYPDVQTLTFRGSDKIDGNGARVTSFPAFPQSTGGGKLKRWGEKIYVGVGQIVRRLNGDGLVDPSFIQMNNGPYFLSLQGGDYHVYPDGRILMSGAHELDDPVRGFVGLYNLIWFTNTGHLDTTRTHRKGDGVIYEIEETPDGKFLCTGTCTVYEGQPVGGSSGCMPMVRWIPPTIPMCSGGSRSPFFHLLMADTMRVASSGRPARRRTHCD